MIGYLGDLVFETSDEKILTFANFVRDTAGRWAEHNVIGKKPIKEFLGPNNDTITFTINVNATLGVNPRDEVTRWAILPRDGTPLPLVIGDRALGSYRWVVDSASQAWGTIFNDGKLYSANITVTLSEYQAVI